MSKDKRIPLPQAMEILHDFYDVLEVSTLQSIEETLREVFGFGPTRIARFKETYLMKLGEKSEAAAIEMKKQMKRRLG